MTPASKGRSTIDYAELATQLDTANYADIYSIIVNAPFNNEVDMAFLFLGFICIFIMDEEIDDIHLKAASNTKAYREAIGHFKFKTTNYHLDFNKNKDNMIVRAIAQGTPQSTVDWTVLNRGETPTETVRLNQASSGIAYSTVYPFTRGVRGALMFNYYQYPELIGAPQEVFMKRYTALVSACLAK